MFTADDRLSNLVRIKKPRQSGFTLIELMVVIVILGVLAALIVPRLLSRPDQARIAAARTDIATLSQAVKLYRLDNKRYPTTDEGLAVLLPMDKSSGGKTEGYIERLPKDPWGNDYQYLQPGLHGDFDLFSLGADGKAGGEGNDADIGNWQ